MADELIKLTNLFREYGGKLENLTVGYREESGYYISVIDKHLDSTVYCPAHLLIDADDVDIDETGLFIARPERYGENITFLEKYISFHFNHTLVNKLIDEKRQIDSLSEYERSVLKKISFSYGIDNMDNDLEYAKQKIFHSHLLTSRQDGRNVFMPFVTFLNHDKSGIPLCMDSDGITVSGKFDDEVFACYHTGDVLMMLASYGFVTNTEFIYSLPMQLRLPDERMLIIKRDISSYTAIDRRFRWPIVEESDSLITVSWFPMYYENGPRYPARFAESLSRENNISGEDILYSVFRLNLNALLTTVFSLQDSNNGFIQMVISGAKRQLEIIGGSK